MVLEPSRAWTTKDAQRSTPHAEWMEEDVPTKEAEALFADKGIAGFIHIDRQNPAHASSHTAVKIHEKVRN